MTTTRVSDADISDLRRTAEQVAADPKDLGVTVEVDADVLVALLNEIEAAR